MTEIVQHPILYNVDSKGKVRTWRMETEGGKHRTVSGLIDGKQVTSGWVVVEAKNIGRSNATTVEEQALAEVKSDYTSKVEKKYHYSLEEAQKAGSGMKFLQPMLAYKYEDFEEKIWAANDRVFCQPKLDGIRATLTKDGLLSRAGKPLPACPHILASLEWFFERYPDAILDGELYNHDLKNDFNTLTSLIKKMKPTTLDLIEAEERVQYHIYDVPSHPGTFAERLHFMLTKVNYNNSVHLVSSHCVDKEELDEFYAKFLEQGYEGQMVRLNEPYENKRSKSLLKRKTFLDDEYEVIRLESGLGNWAGCAKRVVCKTADGTEFEAGLRGTMDHLRDILNKFNEGNGPRYVTVRYPNLTPDGKPRFGVGTAFYWEKRDD